MSPVLLKAGPISPTNAMLAFLNDPLPRETDWCSRVQRWLNDGLREGLGIQNLPWLIPSEVRLALAFALVLAGRLHNMHVPKQTQLNWPWLLHVHLLARTPFVRSVSGPQILAESLPCP